MDTKIIEYIVAIAEEKSLSRAAEKLYISQPALSQRLKNLEAELDTPLFLRTRDGLALTDAGRIYLNGGLSILQIKENAMKRLTYLAHSTRKELYFACAHSSALGCAQEYRNVHPDIDLNIHRCNSVQATEDLIMGRADLGVILTASLQHSTLEYIPLWKGELVLAIPGSHPELSQDDIRKNQFNSIRNDYYILNRAPSFLRDAEERALHAMGIEPTVICDVEDNTTRRYMLNKELGNAFLPSGSYQDGDTYRTYALNPPLTFYIAAAYPKTITLSDPMKALIHSLLTRYDTAAP